MKRNIDKGFSLAELGIAMVILLIVATIATIATISYFTIIDDAKEVKVVEESKTIRLSLARQGIDIRDYSIPVVYDDLEPKVKDVLEYHLENGTNLIGTVFQNKAILKDGEYIIGELRMKENVYTVLKDLFNVDKVNAEELLEEIHVRKLNNNKMNKLFNEDLKGDWYVVDRIEVMEKKPVLVETIIPNNYKSGLLDNSDIIEDIDFPRGIYDDYSNTIKDMFDTTRYNVYFNRPINIRGYYLNVHSGHINSYLRISFYRGSSLLKTIDASGNRTINTYYSIDLKEVDRIAVFRSSSNGVGVRLYELDFFGSYYDYIYD